MLRRVMLMAVAAVAVVGLFLLGLRTQAQDDYSGTSSGPTGRAAGIPEDNGTKGYQDQYGQYLVVPDWPKHLPDQGTKWTWGSMQGVFAESANRIFILQRGELPAMKRPPNTAVPQFGPSLSFPVNAVPFRNHSQGVVASPPNNASAMGITREGVDFRWKNILFIVNREGNLVEAWNQWDSMFKRPHSIFISPYDPEKNVWVVDDMRHQIYKLSNDGKKLLLTLGVKDTPGSDSTHFGRPTFLGWLPDGTMFLTDGYLNTRVVKFDKDGKFIKAWGQKGNPPNETRPGYFNTVHGLAIDPVDRRLYVSDRSNRRIQVFDEEGKFIDQWWVGHVPSHIYQLYMGTDRTLWGADAGTNSMVQWDRNGKFLYSWGFLSEDDGGLWCNHGLTVDEESNFYTADVCRGSTQKFTPKPGAVKTKLLGNPVRVAWK